MFNRRGLIQTLLVTPLVSLFKPKIEENIIMASNPALYEEDIKKNGSVEKIPGLNYPIYCSGLSISYLREVD